MIGSFVLSLVLLTAAPSQNIADGFSIDSRHRDAFLQVASDRVITPQEREFLRERGIDIETIREFEQWLKKQALRPRRAGVAYLALPLREPMGTLEVERVRVLLNLSPEQSAYLEWIYQEYREAAPAFWMQLTAPLWEQSAATAALDATSPEHSVAFASLLAEAAQIDDSLGQYDNAFLDSLTPVLADEQLQRLERARALRYRGAVRVDREWHPGCDVDLTESYLELLLRDSEKPRTVEPAVDAVLAAYEATLTGLTTQLRKAVVEAEIARSAALAHAASVDQDSAAWKGVLGRRRTQAVEAIRLAKQIHDLNVSTLQSLQQTLSAPEVQQLKDLFLARSYPVVYPHATGVQDFVEQLLAGEALDPEAHALMELMASTLQADVGSANEKMVQRYLRWRRDRAETGGFAHDSYREYREDMLVFLGQRNAAMKRTLNVLAPVLPSAQGQFEALRREIDAELESRTNPTSGPNRMGWPDPHDRFHDRE